MNQRILYKFFRGEDSSSDQKTVMFWLEEDPANLKNIIRERKIFDTMLLAGEQQPDAQRKGFIARMPRWTKELARTAAIIALIIGCGYYLLRTQMEQIALLSNTVTVPAGQRANITLPDGTNVWLNSLSEISYPILFMGRDRKVKLTGEAFFDVKHAAGKPFVVETSLYDIRVLGTKFNVLSSSSGGGFSTSVLEGRVMVTDRRNPDNRILLAADQEVQYMGRRLVVQQIADTEIFRWREGLICFRDESLSKLLNRFRRNYDVNIVFRSDDLPDNVMSGKLRVSDGIFHALRVLQKDAPFSWQWNEKDNIVYISSVNDR